MTTQIRNPISRAEDATDYVITAEMFFCLLQLYRDFSNKHAGFELTAYYDLYIQISENKRVLSALLTPKANLSAYLESDHFDYDIAHQKRVDRTDAIWNESAIQLVWEMYANFQDLIVPAVMLKKIYQAYQIFLRKNTTNFSLAWHHYHLAFLGDEPLMALEIYPVTDATSWMNGDLGGLQGYVTCDLNKDLWLDEQISVLPKLTSALYKKDRKQRARLNQKIRKRGGLTK